MSRTLQEIQTGAEKFIEEIQTGLRQGELPESTVQASLGVIKAAYAKGLADGGETAAVMYETLVRNMGREGAP